MLPMLAGVIAFLAMVVPSFWALRPSMIPSASITTNTVDRFRATSALRATAWLARSVRSGVLSPYPHGFRASWTLSLGCTMMCSNPE
jgi:hypothetical protein